MNYVRSVKNSVVDRCIAGVRLMPGGFAINALATLGLSIAASRYNPSKFTELTVGVITFACGELIRHLWPIPADARISAVLRNEIVKVKLLIKKGVSLNEKDRLGQTPLHVASRYGRTDIVKTLIKAGVSRNEKDRMGQTPLHVASRYGRTDIVKILIKAGAPINEKDRSSDAPLHVASRCGRTDVVKILIKAGAPINERDAAGQTPLHVASRYGCTKIVEILIKAGAPINEKDAARETPLHKASKYGYTDIVEILIKAGAPINEKDCWCETPLHIASRYGRIDVIKILIKADAPINEKDRSGQTPLHLAVRKNYINVAKLLINNGANPKLVDLTKLTNRLSQEFRSLWKSMILDRCGRIKDLLCNVEYICLSSKHNRAAFLSRVTHLRPGAIQFEVLRSLFCFSKENGDLESIERLLQVFSLRKKSRVNLPHGKLIGDLFSFFHPNFTKENCSITKKNITPHLTPSPQKILNTKLTPNTALVQAIRRKDLSLSMAVIG